jgi:DNA gyrase/topoisomerase IV subunit A
MLQNLHHKFILLEEERTELFTKLEKLDGRILNYKPAADKWSIVQIVFHLVKTEKLVVISINRELKNIDTSKKLGMKERLSALLLNTALKTNFKFKAPEIVRNVPVEYDINELITKWITVRNNLKQALEKLNSDSINKFVFEHPYSGKLDAVQTLNFLHNHFNHHLKQIEKISTEC